ncbi:SGNH hydrolase-type esterase domain-containing protein [Lophiotrema nucula]|uniref:SGNH hydrolase-type esterase domain-containing protein n=1 Tax=Lophiotrema nucula TaxID=690887 RepID=A0A6A5Z4Q3_9PLEO|nr:SGNH hydrolase-type esterase domain-containing protein [Lophiotrema nucula]
MAYSSRFLLARALLLAHCISLYRVVVASPLHDALRDLAYSPYNDTQYAELGSLTARQDEKVLLRLMPLGASITQGQNSNPENGYRKNLRDELRFLGYPVNMVGCQSTGDFADKQHEGHPGAIISGVYDFVDCSIGQKPNLVLINLGTNDCVGADQFGGLAFAQGTYDRMKSLVDKLFTQIDGTTILLSTLLPNGNDGGIKYVPVANEGYRRLVLQYQAQGKKIALAEMNNGFITIDDINPADGTHPNNLGYKKMAAVWAATFNTVQQKGWITPPAELSGPDEGGNDCLPSPDNFEGPVQTQAGMQPAYQDGPYAHSQTLRGNVSKTIFIAPKGDVSIINQFHFAQLVNLNGVEPGAETDELIRVLDPDQITDNNLPAVSFILNSHGDLGGLFIPIDVGQSCLNRGVRWGDINGDGLDDFICLSNPAGDMRVSINMGGNPPTFKYLGVIRPNSGGYAQEDVRLGDIDGDGRLDFCHIQNPGGNIFCFRNGGQGLAPTEEYGGYWQGMVGGPPTFDAKGMPGNQGVRLLDINGDFRADWVYVFPDGHTRIFINHRGTKTDGGGLKPAWVEASSAHPAFSSAGKAIDLDHIKFGRVFGTGKQDFVWVRELATKVDDEILFSYFFEVYQNTGTGGTRLRGDGARYCDMYGRGRDDFMYIFGDGTGKIDLFENTGVANKWNVHNTILTTGRDRKSVHFGDWNGDGLCDVIALDKHTGNADIWFNNYKAGNAVPTFTYQGGAITGSKCTQGWGVGVFDIGARFADLDGDGRVDYLCMEKDGRTTGWLNGADGMTDLGQVKFSVQYDRANHQWADVNGDKKADFLWVDKFAGGVKVWINGGAVPSSGSSYLWLEHDDYWHEGVDRGANIQFPKMSQSGRADMVNELPESGVAYTYFNTCPGAGSGKGPGPDDGPIVDPELPEVPGGGDPGTICPRVHKCGQFPDLPHFVAMGDSYSAGIGTGDRIKDNPYDAGQRCAQGTNAYSRQLFYQEPSLRNKIFDFISCSGDKLDNILTVPSGPKKDPRDKTQLSMLQSLPSDSFSVILLSIGGNNVKFSKIAANCLILGKGDESKAPCQFLIDWVEQRLTRGQTAERTALGKLMQDTYRSLITAADAEDATVVVTGYARFFNEDDQSSNPDEDCATRTLTVIDKTPFLGDYKPYLTTSIRGTVNSAVIALNQLIQESIDAVNGESLGGRKIRYLDIDQHFEGYRFCDKDPTTGVIKPFEDSFMFLPLKKDILLDPNSGTPIPGRDTDDGALFSRDLASDDCDFDNDDDDSLWLCVTDGLTKENLNADLYPELAAGWNDERGLKDWAKVKFNKAFHPKSIVHTNTYLDIQSKWWEWQREGPCPCEP